jgi:hypothetical protein
MRNLFDQYDQPENRLTHALAVCLNEDRVLLREFLRWIDVKPPVQAKHLLLVEQSLPGDAPERELDAERRGLPDIVVHDDDSWCLLVESKVQASLMEDQLRRQQRTLRRRGFDDISRLTLTKSGSSELTHVIPATWSGLYEWLGMAAQRGDWADRLRTYLRAAEVRLAQVGYLTEGTLTMFDGFPFSNTNPYTYGEGKRLLKLALDELAKDSSLRAVGIDPTASRRSAITGQGGRAVWDFLSLKERPKHGAFTAYPHFTLAVHADHLEVAITVPNGVIEAVRRRLAGIGATEFVAINAAIIRRARRLIARGAWVEAGAAQRHYLGQRSTAITDAALTFRLETSQSKKTGRVKPQPEWAALFAALPQRKRSNIQFQYRVRIPWETRGIDTRESLRMIVDAWIALMPFLDALRANA